MSSAGQKLREAFDEVVDLADEHAPPRAGIRTVLDGIPTNGLGGPDGPGQAAVLAWRACQSLEARSADSDIKAGRALSAASWVIARSPVAVRTPEHPTLMWTMKRDDDEFALITYVPDPPSIVIVHVTKGWFATPSFEQHPDDDAAREAAQTAAAEYERSGWELSSGPVQVYVGKPLGTGKWPASVLLDAADIAALRRPKFSTWPVKAGGPLDR